MRVNNYFVIVLVIYITIWKYGINAASTSNDKCIPRDYSLDTLAFPICHIFKHNSCCDPTSVLGLYKAKYEELESIKNEKCKALTEARICYLCDPRVGSGIVQKVCQSYCNDWYASCIDEFYESTGVQGGKLSLCNQNSILCSKLGDIISNGNDFCENSGLFVAQDINQDLCFDGTPPQTKGVLVNPQSSSSSYSSSNRPDSSASVIWNNYIKMLLNTAPKSLHPYIRNADKVAKKYIKYVDDFIGYYGIFLFRVFFLLVSFFLVVVIFLLKNRR